VKLKHRIACINTAKAWAACSVGERLKVGAVIVKNNRPISTGYNALPEHLHGPLEDEKGNTKPEVRHAEKNALMGLVRSSESAAGATMFATHSCCYLCSVDIVDAGIVEFVFSDFYRTHEGLIHLLSAGVKVFHLSPDSGMQLQLHREDFVNGNLFIN
jgi:dCMP deaminase